MVVVMVILSGWNGSCARLGKMANGDDRGVLSARGIGALRMLVKRSACSRFSLSVESCSTSLIGSFAVSFSSVVATLGSMGPK